MTSESPQNILLICLDSVRKDYFDTTATRVPEIADVSFDQCRAASSWSAPSYASMISGLLPSQHGVHSHSKSFDSLPFEETVFDVLNDHRTVGISANVYAGPDFGFDRYFDDFVEVATHIPYPQGADPQSFLHVQDGNMMKKYLSFGINSLREPHTLKSLGNGVAGLVRSISSNTPLPRVVDDGAKGALRAVKNELERGEEPTFIFLSLMEGHLPHEPALYFDSEYYDGPISWSSEQRDVWDLCLSDEYDEQYWNRRNQFYQASIDYLDRIIDEIVSIVSQRTDRETTTIITADHGENLGTEVDGDLANHQSSLSEGLLHVPLYLVDPPEGYQPNEARFFSHLNLPQLIKGMAYGETSNVFREKIPAEVIGMSPGPAPNSDINTDYWDRMIRCGYNGSKKLIWDSLNVVAEYRLDENRHCWQRKKDQPRDVPNWARELFEISLDEYKQHALQSDQTMSIDSATEDRLEKLGYL